MKSVNTMSFGGFKRIIVANQKSSLDSSGMNYMNIMFF
jgi:hypothetical protein